MAVDDFEEDVGDEDRRLDGHAEASKEFLVCLVDASQAMRGQAGAQELEGDFSPDDSFLVVALKVVRELLKQHIVGSPADEMALVFFAAREAKGADGGMSGARTLLGLEPGSAARVRELDAMLGAGPGGWEARVGWGPRPAASVHEIHEALFQAHQVFAAHSSRAARRVVLLTATAQPLGDDAAVRNRAVARAGNLHELAADVQLLPLAPPGQAFDMDFWRLILAGARDELGGPMEPQPLQLQDLVTAVRRRSYKKRALGSLPWTLTPGLVAGVKLYALIAKASPSKSVRLALATNTQVASSSKALDSGTGALVQQAEVRWVYPKQAPPACSLRLSFTSEERAATRLVRPPGLTLVGFKRLACLREWHQLRHPTFVYPDEAARPGSARLLIALHARLLARGCFALCSFVRTSRGGPRLVALLPQQEELDEGGTQLTPPGFNMQHLPYADDVRWPEDDPSFAGGPEDFPPPSQEQARAAGALLARLTLRGFQPGGVPNPQLQRHFQTIESLALRGEAPAPDAAADQTLPDAEAMQRVAGAEVQAFKDATYGVGRDGGAGEKRRRQAAAAEAPDDAGFAELLRAGTLQKLTLPKLREYCKRHRLATAGLKPDLLARVSQHLGCQP